MKILNNLAVYLIACFFTVSSVQAKNKTEWYKVFENDSATFYVDTYMLIYENGYRMFWLVEDLKKPFLKKYKSILKYKFLDCEKNTSKTFQSFAYKLEMAQGTESIKLPNDTSWNKNDSEKSILSLTYKLCNDPYLLSKTRGL